MPAERACGVVAGPGRRQLRRGGASPSLAVAGPSRRPTAYVVPSPHTGLPVIRAPSPASWPQRHGSDRDPETVEKRASREPRQARAAHDARRHARQGRPRRAHGPEKPPQQHDRVITACPQAVMTVEKEVLPCILKTVIRHSPIPHGDREEKTLLVLSWLLEFRWSSFELLATRLGMRSKTSYKFFRALVEEGLIQIFKSVPAKIARCFLLTRRGATQLQEAGRDISHAHTSPTGVTHDGSIGHDLVVAGRRAPTASSV